MVVNDSSTLEQMLSADQAASVQAFRKLFRADAEPVLIALDADQPVSQVVLTRLQNDLASLPGVKETFTTRSSRSRDDPMELQGRLASDVELVIVWTDATYRGLDAARALQRDIDQVVSRHLGPEYPAAIVGVPRLRAASWEMARADARLMLPLLIVASVGVVYAFFRSWSALWLSLAMTSLTTLCCLALQYLLEPQINALLVSLLPVIWAIATLDVFHLYVAAALDAQRAGSGGPRATQRVVMPCLLTTLTTAGCFLTLTVADASPLVARFGFWAAIGTVIAFVLTFTLGRRLLANGHTLDALPRWPARLSLSLARVAQRWPAQIITFWGAVTVLSMVVLSDLPIGSDYPQVFAPHRSIARDIERMQAITGSDLNPVEVILRPKGEDAGQPDRLFGAVMFLTNYLRTIDETRFILPFALVEESELQRLLGNVAGDAQVISDEAGMPLSQITPWYSQDAVRLQWYLTAADFGRKGEIFAWVSNFAEDALPNYTLTLSGPGFHTHQVEVLGLKNLIIGFACSLGIIVVVLLLAVRDPVFTLAGLAGTLLPLLLVGGCMALLQIPWSVALLPVPALLLGLANDDAIHMIWGRGGGRRGQWRRNAANAGPALLATSVILALATATMLLSGIQSNRFVGMLTPLGLLLAFVCNLTLLPAVSSWRRRSLRPPHSE